MKYNIRYKDHENCWRSRILRTTERQALRIALEIVNAFDVPILVFRFTRKGRWHLIESIH